MAQISNILGTSRIIVEGYDGYLADYNALTSKAQALFEQQNWKALQDNGRARLRLYKRQVGQLSMRVRGLLQEDYDNHGIWQTLKAAYAQEVAPRGDTEVAETFFNSVCRKVIGGMGADKHIMFVEGEILRMDQEASQPIYRTYELRSDRMSIFRQILADYAFAVPFEDADRDTSRLLARFQELLPASFEQASSLRIEVLRSLFFRNKAAYLVGRIQAGEELCPFVIPFLHEADGIYADSLIMDAETVSIIFSFTRSYFQVAVDIPSQMVRFLKSMMPGEAKSELYNSIGFHKHGKTELYRDFARHLKQSDDEFVVAAGIRGMVMAVFTLPSYPIVFKLIKDKFDPPKITNRGMVKMKYRLVKYHDRVGRMADTHEFDYFAFPLHRFSKELIDELLRVAPI